MKAAERAIVAMSLVEDVLDSTCLNLRVHAAITDAIRAAQLEMRERCAKVADDGHCGNKGQTCMWVADAIRKLEV